MRAREISLDVDVMCEGCASAVRRICARIDGVTRVDVDVDSKTVVIVGDGLDPDDVRARVAKCGRCIEGSTDSFLAVADAGGPHTTYLYSF